MLRLFSFRRIKTITFAMVLLPTLSSPLYGLYLDGSGHYGLRGYTIVNPGSAPDKGMPQAIDQSFRLLGEVRTGDSASFFAELRLFNDPYNAYLGDNAQANRCNGDDNCVSKYQTCTGNNCASKPQSTLSPGYKWLTPRVTEFYLRYAFDYCILEAGRRPRDWGMGIFLDSGKEPFAVAASIYDGVSCSVNFQKFQDLAFTFGYDKLAETGAIIQSSPGHDPSPGPDTRRDDVDQYFLSIEFDDRKTRANSFFTKQIGIYAANIKSGSLEGGGLDTDLSVADLYMGFYFPRVTYKNEFLFYLGTTADPNTQTLGGAQLNSSGTPATNKLSSVGVAGSLEWLAVGPVRTNSEDYIGVSGNRHIYFTEYALAPGDKQGYYDDSDAKNTNSPISITKRAETAKAMAFHSNFEPALILFNGRSQISDLRKDGIFDPTRFTNAQLYSLGYRYENKDYGNLESKLITALLIQGIPDDAKTYYASQATKPVGYYGKDLGYELDLKYWKTFTGGIEAGMAAGLLSSGKAWQVKDDQKALTSYILQAHIAYKF